MTDRGGHPGSMWPLNPGFTNVTICARVPPAQPQQLEDARFGREIGDLLRLFTLCDLRSISAERALPPSGAASGPLAITSVGHRWVICTGPGLLQSGRAGGPGGF